MRIITFLSLILISTNFFSQSSQIDIDWFGEEHYNIGNSFLIVPNSKNFKNNYSYGDYYKIVKQWESDKIIDDSSVEISNIIYTDIDRDGMMKGYDFELVKLIRDSHNLPMSILGGASSLENILNLWTEYGLIGAAVGSLFIFKGKYKAVLVNYPTSLNKQFYS